MTRVLFVALALPLALDGPAPDLNPFAFFEPAVVLTSGERRQLARDEPVVRLLPATGTDVGTFAAIRTRIGGDRLVGWMQHIEQLKRGGYVKAVRRFSDPPQASDLEGFALEPDELNDLRKCRPGNCGLKLSATEMQQFAEAAGAAGDGWRVALQRAFREAMVARVRAYLDRGYPALPPVQDHPGIAREPVARAAALIGRLAFLSERWPAFADHIARHPQSALPGTESFLYWSNELLRGRPIFSVTHVTIARGQGGVHPDVLVAGMQVFSTHYTDASVGVTALTLGTGGWNYLIYVNRSDVDVLSGRFGGLVRMGVQQRLPNEARELLRTLRRRLEAGEPAQETKLRPPARELSPAVEEAPPTWLS